MNAEMVKVLLNGQFEIIIPKHRADRPDWYTEEGWEKPRLSRMHEIITAQKKPVVYYVGAEEGEMPALCQMWGAEVVMFEPNPKVWSNTKAIWKANKLATPHTFQGFCSSETHIIDPDNGFKLGFPACADDEIVAAHGFKELYLEGKNYNQIKIDDVDYKPPTIITFDCEGSDWEVMKGAKDTLINHKPIIVASIHPEFMFHQFGQYSSDFRNWIKSFGYKETYIDYKHELHMLYEPI